MPRPVTSNEQCRFLACLYVLKHVLPVLGNLSKSFQHSTVNFSHLKPEIVRAKAALDEVATKEVPNKQFCLDVKEGKMVLLQFPPLLKYVSALKENIDLRFQNRTPSLFLELSPSLIQPLFLQALQNFPLTE